MDHVVSQIVDAVVEKANKKNKGDKKHFFLSLLENHKYLGVCCFKSRCCWAVCQSQPQLNMLKIHLGSSLLRIDHLHNIKSMFHGFHSSVENVIILQISQLTELRCQLDLIYLVQVLACAVEVGCRSRATWWTQRYLSPGVWVGRGYRRYQQILNVSLSATSKPIFASKHSLESFCRVLKYVRAFAPLRPQHFNKLCSNLFALFFIFQKIFFE